MTPRLPRSGALAAALALVLAGLALPGSTAAGAERALPSRKEWLADVRDAMKGSKPYVRERVEEAAAAPDPKPKLAINFDIDNTVIATDYDGGGAIEHMLKFVMFADDHDVAIMFNSARLKSKKVATLRELDRAGYPVTELCLRKKGETKSAGKQRCRQRFVDDGYTIIANIGNRPTDFEGGNYDRAFKLPNYRGQLA